jgi:hypothetical protein
MMKFIYLLLIITLFGDSHAEGEKSVIAVKSIDRFHQLNLTRGWELGIWRIQNEDGDTEIASNFKLSMTAQAFRYWLFVREGLIKPFTVHEAQIRKSFEMGILSYDTMKNPLNRNNDNTGGFGIDNLIDAEEYRNLSSEFEAYFKK